MSDVAVTRQLKLSQNSASAMRICRFARVRDPNAAEAAYQRAMDLYPPNDDLSRSACIKQIGRVHHERLIDARQQNEPEESLLRHAQAAEQCYLQGLQLCPKDAWTALAPMHGQLATLYHEVGQFHSAREHYELNAKYS